MIEKAIFKINPNAEFSINADDIDQITWLNGTTPISKSDIQAQISAVEFDTAMEFLRIKRNKLLRDTDFYALSDVTMSSDMQTYRQKRLYIKWNSKKIRIWKRNSRLRKNRGDNSEK